MRKTRKQNLVIVTEATINDVRGLILDWIASGKDIPTKGDLKGWILFGGSLLRFDPKDKKIYLAFRTRENHPNEMIEFTVQKIEGFVLKHFSGSFREFADQGYRYGIQKGYENYRIFEWNIPRCYEEVLEVPANKQKKKVG